MSYIKNIKNLMLTGRLSMPELEEGSSEAKSIAVEPDGRVVKNNISESGYVTEDELDEALQNIEFPTWITIQDKPIVVAQGDTQEDARVSIGAGTSDLTIGTSGTTAMAGNKVPTATQRGGVLMQSDIPDLTGAEVTIGDINTVLAALRAAGILG